MKSHHGFQVLRDRKPRVVATETSDLYPAGFLIIGLIMNLLQHIFSQAENSVFQFPKSRGRIILCVSPTFASPIEKPATSAHRRICREIIGNTEGNAKTADSLRRCK